ncbi:unnamed protein product [Symbiodinium sp. CCMP2456]|nr:unnamed protein product [Symbiodinium sp. CCMP2456]
MSPNVATEQERLPQSADVTYGSVGGLVNGVVPAPPQIATQPSEVSAGDVNPSRSEAAPSTQEQVEAGHEIQLAAEPPAVGQSGVQGQGQAAMAATVALEDGSVHGVSANMEVQQGTSALTVVRWISRLNDFLANLGHAVFGSVGFNTIFHENIMGGELSPIYLEGSQAQEDSTTGSSEVQAEVQRQLEVLMRTQSSQLEEMKDELMFLRAERARLLSGQHAQLPRGDDGPQRQGDPSVVPHAQLPSQEAMMDPGNKVIRVWCNRLSYQEAMMDLGNKVILRCLCELNRQEEVAGPSVWANWIDFSLLVRQGECTWLLELVSRLVVSRQDFNMWVMVMGEIWKEMFVSALVLLQVIPNLWLHLEGAHCDVPMGPTVAVQGAEPPVAGMTPSERLLEKLAEGIQQLQRVQIDHLEKAERKKDDETPEQCKPGTASLPTLPMPNGNESAVALQDWIEVIDGPLRDVSDSSSWWWDAVKKRAQESYQRWVASGPYERLALKPPTAEDLEKGRYSRLSARTAGIMMLQAMAESVRAEMVARAITRSPVALLFRLYTMYQPGGESEKAYILQYLVTPPKAQTAAEMVSVLRQRERMLLRADNLNIAKPDPSLLVRGLNSLVAELWAKDRDVTFRTQLVKSRLGVDVSPTWETALQLHQHLRAEAENLVNGLPTTPKTGVGDGQRDAKLRPMQTGTPAPSRPPSTTPTPTGTTTQGGVAAEKKCKWFTEPGGCRRGASCKFVHSFEGISKKNRCYTCGAEGHVSSACPTKADNGDMRPDGWSGSGEIYDCRARTSAIASDVTYTAVFDELGFNYGVVDYFYACCEISWKRGVFKVIHPVWGELRTSSRGGCPELAQEQAAKLVNDIETKKLNEFKEGVSMLKSKLEHLAHEEKLPWTGYVMRYLVSGQARDLWKALQGSFMKFLPERLLDPVCRGVRLDAGWDHLKSLPFPRRMRKRMLESRKWIVHVPGHRDDVPLKPEAYGEDAVLVTISGELPLPVYEDLLCGAATGRIAAVVGSTPGTSMCKEEQSLRTAKVLGLYVVGRLARSTSRTGFLWSVPKSGGEDYVSRLLKEFSEAASMDQHDVSRGSSEGQPKIAMMVVTNYHVRSTFELDIIRPDEIAYSALLMVQQDNWRRSKCSWKKAAKMKYLLVAKFTLPKSYVTGEFEPTGTDPPDEELGHKDLFDEEDRGDGHDVPTDDLVGDSRDEAFEADPCDDGGGVGDIPLDVKPPENGVPMDIEAPEATYLLFAEPLLNDKGTSIASAIQSIVLYLQSLNIPVLRFHSDRAAQLTSRPLVQWLHQQAIRTSTSTPGVPQENGAAESAVKELKLSTRKILSTSGLDKGFWPVAAKAAASTQRARVLRQVSRMMTSFGAKVLVKKRRYAASGALITLEFDERWSEGSYLGLSDQVANGHLVYVDGIFTHTRSVRDKAKLVDAAEDYLKDDAGTLEFEGDAEPPLRKRRIHGKSSPRVAVLDGEFGLELCDDEIPSDYEEDFDAAKTPREQVQDVRPRVAVLSQPMNSGPYDDDVQSDQEDLQNPEDYAKEIIYSEEDVTEEVIEKLFELLPNQRLPRQTEDHGSEGLPPKAWASGVYRHGGVLGVRNSSKEFPYATRLVNQFIRTVLGESVTWSTFSLHRNLSVKRHRDSHNARDELSYLIPISDFRQGGLWIQADIGEAVGDDEVTIVDG